MMCKGTEDGVSIKRDYIKLEGCVRTVQKGKCHVCLDSETSFNSFHLKKVMQTWNTTYFPHNWSSICVNFILLYLILDFV